jgi:hypothetical protein
VSDQLLFNLLVSLLRFGNIFFLTCVPLLSKDSPALLRTTPYVGFSGVIIVILSLFSIKFQHIIVRFILYIVILCGLMLGVLFGGLGSYLLLQYPFFFAFSVLLGTSLVGTEILGLRLAITSTERGTLRTNLALFNSLKVSGYAFGFLLGCLVVGSDLSVSVAHLFIILISLATIAFALLGILRFRNRPICDDIVERSPATIESLNQRDAAGEVRRFRWSTIIYFGFIVADVTVFSFWYVYIPYRLHTVNGVPSATVGAWLTAQAFIHALFQYPWRLLLKYTGEVAGYLVSLAMHILIVAVITHLVPTNYGLMTILFVVMGMVNAGSYISAGTLFHSTINSSLKFRSVNIHQIGSSIGKYYGTVIANSLVR